MLTPVLPLAFFKAPDEAGACFYELYDRNSGPETDFCKNIIDFICLVRIFHYFYIEILKQSV